MVFGHGDLHGGNMVVAQTDEGWRLSGIFDLQNGGIVHIYDEFLRIQLLDVDVGRKIVETYNRLPAQARVVSTVTLDHFYRAFVFYLLHLSTDESFSSRLIAMLEMETTE